MKHSEQECIFYPFIIRLEMPNLLGRFGEVVGFINRLGGEIGSVKLIKVSKNKVVREIEVICVDERERKKIIKGLKGLKEVKLLKVVDKIFELHEEGKIEMVNKVEVKDQETLAKVYTPGVAKVCLYLKNHPEEVYKYTIKGHTVAVVTDGSAVLGLGNIGPLASLPVMEGKCMLFKEFAGLDAFPLAITTQEIDQFVEVVKHLSLVFGGINLEDISAPRCFEIERRLREELDIPVIHDDQHGTAIVVLAGLINVERLLKRSLKDMKIVISGAGASAIGTAKLLLKYGVKHLILCDTAGAIYQGRKEKMNPYKEELAALTNPEKLKGSLSEVLVGADVFIGLSAPNILKPEDLKIMAKDRVVFALSNPDPEIAPELALPLVRVLATGRSDYPNQINNALAFPGLFKGLLEAKAKKVDEEVFIEAAKAIAYIIKDDELKEDYIIPSIFDKRVVKAVAKAVVEKLTKSVKSLN
ncbi:NAD-dependent malic enzyme [Thermodesulfobacterium sp. TA1]|uniref:NAD-dependent malic enzyme n=1 Tax=Thermodesulfobacterium sp. TA1 TaxID=2234087 RepID=UPI001232D887|nr:NAD-dependent malic enzyme [Thermodesulfobacterium sp. TA1]QER41594.1 NAD-dependent malic enzyme [Thermodesulfobacterium sp. TA1]